MEYIINLNDAEHKALSYIAKDPKEWIQNAASERARLAMLEIFNEEVKRMTEDPNIDSIPADIESVVLSANIILASDRNEDVFNT